MADARQRRRRTGERVQDLHGGRLRHDDDPAVGRAEGDAAGRLQPRLPARRPAGRLPGERLRDALHRRPGVGCSTRSSRCSTRCPRTSTPTTRRATSSTCSPPGSASTSTSPRRSATSARWSAAPPTSAASAAPWRASSSRWSCRSPTYRCASRTRAASAGRSSNTPVEAPPPSFVVYCDKPVAEGGSGGHRPLHRAAQAGRNLLPPTGEGTEEERHVMRTCQSCGLENPPDRDFCECGEYLRWEPTGYVQAITPEMAAQAAAEAAPPASPRAGARRRRARRRGAGPPRRSRPLRRPRLPAAPAPRSARRRPPTPRRPARGEWQRSDNRRPARRKFRGRHRRRRLPRLRPRPPGSRPARGRRRPAVQARRPGQPPPQAPAFQDPDMARITLRLPDRDADKEQTLATAVEPGQRERVLALVRNQSGIVDNYQLRVDGLPEDWWSIYPDTVYLVPFGTGGTYEQEVEIHLHPPRTPDAEAKMWDLKVVAHSKANEVTAAAAPLALVIKPYTETTTKVRPERAKGRRKANFDVAGREQGQRARCSSRSRARTPTASWQFGFNRPPSEIPPGQTVTDCDAGPPAQADLDRPPAGPPAVGQHADRRGGRGAARRRAHQRRGAQGRAGAPRRRRRACSGARQRRRRPRRLRPARLQAAGLRARHEHRPRRHHLPQAAASRPADAGPADEGDERRR